MKSPVLVVANAETGEVLRMRTITNPDGSTREVGVVMVQSRAISGLAGIARVSTRTAFVTLEQEVLEFLDSTGATLKDKHPFPADGKIVIKESLTPYVRKDGTKQEAKINPTTKEMITYKGQPVYRNSEFTEDLNAQDVFLRDVAPVATEEAAE